MEYILRQKFTDGVQVIVFADDVAGVATGQSTETLEDAMNRALDQVNNWMIENGLTISVSEILSIMMTTKRRYRRP